MGYVPSLVGGQPGEPALVQKRRNRLALHLRKAAGNLIRLRAEARFQRSLQRGGGPLEVIGHSFIHPPIHSFNQSVNAHMVNARSLPQTAVDALEESMAH